MFLFFHTDSLYFDFITLKHTIMKTSNSSNKDVLSEKTLNFAIRIVNMYDYLKAEKKEFIMSKQLMRSGTNPGAMVREAKNAESDKDFIHKLSIAQKETGETLYWLELLLHTKYINQNEYFSMQNDANELMRILRSSILTKKRNLGIKTIAILIALGSVLSLLL